MKLILSILFLSFSVLLSAQTSTKAFDSQFEKMVKLYDMDNSQAQQYRQIALEKMQATVKLKAQEKNYQEKMLEIENNYDNALLSILDDRQKKIFQIQKAMINKVKSSTKKPDKENYWIEQQIIIPPN